MIFQYFLLTGSILLTFTMFFIPLVITAKKNKKHQKYVVSLKKKSLWFDIFMKSSLSINWLLKCLIGGHFKGKTRLVLSQEISKCFRCVLLLNVQRFQLSFNNVRLICHRVKMTLVDKMTVGNNNQNVKLQRLA